MPHVNDHVQYRVEFAYSIKLTIFDLDPLLFELLELMLAGGDAVTFLALFLSHSTYFLF